MSWFNFFGFCVLILLFIPNVIYAFHHQEVEHSRVNLMMDMFEQIGRYGTIAFMCVQIRIFNYGFCTKNLFLLWALTTLILILLYWFGWIFYYFHKGRCVTMYLAVIPSIIFINTGIFMRYVALILFACIFAVGHCYVTFKNNHVDLLEGEDKV